MSSKIKWNKEEMKWEGITVLQVKFWEECFPGVDVVDILTKKMVAWLLANPAKAHKKNWSRFIVNWLSREEKNGGRH